MRRLGVLALMCFMFLPYPAQASFQCKGKLRRTSKKVTCQLAMSKCRPGHVVWHPACRERCLSQAQPAFTKCEQIDKERKSKCTQGQARRNPAVVCRRLTRKLQAKCAKDFQASQTSCNTLNKEGAGQCKDTFTQERKRCVERQEKESERCKDLYNKGIDGCNAKRKRRQAKRERICRKPFSRCRKGCSKADNRWACYKGCFQKQFKCVSMNQGKEIRCPVSMARQLQKCDLASGVRMLKCVRKAEAKLYSCAKKLSKTRADCLLNGGKGYASCMKTLDKKRLACWLKNVHAQFYCMGGTVEDCRGGADKKRFACLKRCPRCLLRR
ncbi:MAG: hypothetical protein CL920_18305 [Deltaproteobacteria bacterium]|nr:hypothetical protein [Deltaproteobacteria bacterium]